jgi:hypothetical protein
MKPNIAPIAAPEAKVALRERAPLRAPVAQMRAAKPTPIQKMEGINPAPYRTDKAGGIDERFLNFAAMNETAGDRLRRRARTLPRTRLTLVLLAA